MSQIKRIGSYLETDEQGHLQPIADAANIARDWQPAVEMLVQAYRGRWEGAVHSIYVRGSLPKGLALPDVSDIDSFAVLQQGHEQTESYDVFAGWAKDVERCIRQAFPFVAGVELGLEQFGGVLDRKNVYAFVLKTEAACVYGENLAARLEPYRITPDIAFQTQWFGRHLALFHRDYPIEPEAERSEFIVWLMRRFVRLGMELVMVEEERFTRDLYLCYESFAEHYPEQAGNMYRALELAVNPETGPGTEAFAREFGGWLEGEAERTLQGWDYQKTAEGFWAR